jgi:hypothetical protein
MSDSSVAVFPAPRPRIHRTSSSRGSGQAAIEQPLGQQTQHHAEA